MARLMQGQELDFRMRIRARRRCSERALQARVDLGSRADTARANVPRGAILIEEFERSRGNSGSTTNVLSVSPLVLASKASRASALMRSWSDRGASQYGRFRSVEASWHPSSSAAAAN